MKILAFVDLHGAMSVLKKIVIMAKRESADCIVCAGDITIFGNSLQQLLNTLDSVGLPVIIMHGNHEDESTMRRLCDKSKNLHFLHKGTYEIGDVMFLGYGGGGFSTTDDEFDAWAKKTMENVVEGKKIVLVTHAPPYGTKLDPILDQPAGSKSIRQFIKQMQPKLAISGHLHENAGQKDKIDGTKLVNPGPWGMMLVV